MSLTALCYYVNNDNEFSIYIVNNNLNKVFRQIQTENWGLLEVFEFYIKLHANKCSKENSKNELTIVFMFIIGEIKLFIMPGLKIPYKEDVKEFLRTTVYNKRKELKRLIGLFSNF